MLRNQAKKDIYRHFTIENHIAFIKKIIKPKNTFKIYLIAKLIKFKGFSIFSVLLSKNPQKAKAKHYKQGYKKPIANALQLPAIKI